MDDEKRVLGVFGLGAIGTVIAHCLKPSPQAFYFNRSAKHSLPLLLENQQLHLDVKLSTASESLALDWLLICLKEYHYEHAISDLAKIIKPNTKVAVIRNGLNLKSPLLAIVQEDQILETMIDCPTQWSSNGYYHALRLPRMTTEQNALGEAFLELFQNDRIRIEQTRDFKTASWEKLIESATLGAILSLSGESAWIFKDDNLVRIYEQLLDESILVAREDGANLDESLKKTY